MRPPLRPPSDDDPPDPLAPTCGDPSDAPVPAAAAPAVDAAPRDLLEIVDPIPAVETIDNPFGLNARELLFVEAFVGAAHFRAAKAYELAGYKVTGAASRANASRMLTRPRIEAAIAARLNDRVKALRIMDGDEALEGISNLGRSDIRKLFPPTHFIAQLPDEVADWIKSVRPGKHGYFIELYDKSHAREVMAKVSGRLKETIKVEHSLEEIMARANRPQPGEAA